jgi:hypothetical protein
VIKKIRTFYAKNRGKSAFEDFVKKFNKKK